MKFLVTGGLGFIGSNFIRYCLDNLADTSILNVDCVTYAGNYANLAEYLKDGRYQHLKVDVCDIMSHVNQVQFFNPDIIVHFAAESHVDRSLKDASPFLRTNIQGTLAVLELSRLIKPRKFIHIGTDEGYGSLSVNASPSKESDILRPRSPYSVSKASADLMALAYLDTYGSYECPVIVTRSSNNYGPYQYPEKAVPLLITNWIENKPYPLYGTGENIREWIHVIDNVKALLRVIEHGEIGEIYNIGSGIQLRNLDVLEIVRKEMGIDRPKIEHVVDRMGHDKRYALNSEKIRKLGWEPSYTFEKGIGETIKWYSSHFEWWLSLKNHA